MKQTYRIKATLPGLPGVGLWVATNIMRYHPGMLPLITEEQFARTWDTAEAAGQYVNEHHGSGATLAIVDSLGQAIEPTKAKPSALAPFQQDALDLAQALIDTAKAITEGVSSMPPDYPEAKRAPVMAMIVGHAMLQFTKLEDAYREKTLSALTKAALDFGSKPD